MMVDSWDMWAHHRPDAKTAPFWHMGGEFFVKAHGLPYPIVRVRVTLDPEGTYYGWQDTGKFSDPPTMIWPNEGLFKMCFAYGPKVEVERGRGRVVRMRVELIEQA